MTIRSRLTWLFSALVALILAGALSVTFLLQKRYTHQEFHQRLRDRAEVTSYVFLEQDELHEEAFEKFQRRYLQTLTGEVLQIYDAQLRPRFIEPDRRIHLSDQLLARIIADKEVYFDVGPRQAVGLFYHDNQGEYVVVAAAENRSGQLRLRHLAEMLALVFGGGLALIYGAARVFAGRALSPITELNDQVNGITARALHQRLDEGPAGQQDEITRLARTFNRLLERLEISFEGQRTFVSNASHELRTPLTATIGEVQVLLARDREPAAYREALASVLGELQQFRTLVNDLLELAQTDAPSGPAEEIRLDELVWEAREALQPAGRRRVQVELGALPENADALVVAGSRALLLRAVLNLLDNALKYSPADAPVRVQFIYSGRELHLRVLDRGIGVAEKDLSHLFQPFFRADNARAVPGHGVGLALAQRILLRHGATLRLSSRPEGGTAAEVVFGVEPGPELK
jgi:signal transduction histidine kinase